MDSSKPGVLFVDDDSAFLKGLIRSVSLRSTIFKCHAAVCETEALSLTKKLNPEVIVLDLAISPTGGPETGISLIPKLLELSEYSRILVLTGSNDAEYGVRCINAGAASFLNKPVDNDHLLALIHDGIQVSHLMHSNKDTAAESMAALGFVTKNDKMKNVLEQVAFASFAPLPTLLCGETGVGKGVIAQAIHKASKQKHGPFIRMQPSFGSQDLITSELFGHNRGAFTGANDSRTGLVEDAHGGTLFIDEIDALPQQTQIALLHVLQEQEFKRLGSNRKIHSNFRLIAATNTPFKDLVHESRLRLDFYHRIAHMVIHIPALRDRHEDIPQLSRDFLSTFSSKDQDSPVQDFSKEALSWLSAQSWPGNVRELQASVERGYQMAKLRERRHIRLSDLKAGIPQKDSLVSHSLSEQLRNYERVIATTEFHKNKQNYSATARALGIDRKRLRRILSREECMA